MAVHEITVAVATHKKYRMPSDGVYLPLQVGKSAHPESCLGFETDDSGDNISELNPYFSELTGLYWMWKNSDADIIGLCHYRRYFKGKNGKLIEEQEILDYLSDYDIILPKKSDLIKTPYEALILASLIEKETLIDEERTLISSAFYNRLKIGMRLQTDPSVMYGVSKTFKGKLTKSHLKKDTPYNTYTRAGLPPTPICMPRESSIYAALHPENSSYLYFVAKTESPKDGHAFTSSLDEHNKAVAAYRKRIKDYKSGKLDTQEEDCLKEESRETENKSSAEENVKNKK